MVTKQDIIVMYGNPGTGKTHIAIGLGIKACNEGYNVYFTTIPQLLTQIREAQSPRTLERMNRRFVPRQGDSENA